MVLLDSIQICTTNQRSGSLYFSFTDYYFVRILLATLLPLICTLYRRSVGLQRNQTGIEVVKLVEAANLNNECQIVTICDFVPAGNPFRLKMRVGIMHV